MKVVSIVGARPQLVKIAPLERSFGRSRSLGGEPIEHIIVHTGQHYDVGLSDIFFEELRIPQPIVNLGVGSGHHGRQTGEMLDKIEQVLFDTRPDIVVTYGDTNSTVAGALAAAKLHVPVAHIEAGVRSFNRRMPEELNRVVADHVSELLLAPTPTAIDNLRHEGLSARAIWTGDVMYDAVLDTYQIAETASQILERFALTSGNYGIVTVHRAENTNDDSSLRNLLLAFNDIAARRFPLVFPVHPRTANRLHANFPAWSAHSKLQLIAPIGYLDMLKLVRHARMMLTDSGGLQKEAFFLGCPCITLRGETEWVETVRGGGNLMAGVEPDAILAAVTVWEDRLAAGTSGFSTAVTTAFGEGRAAEQITAALLDFCHRLSPVVEQSSDKALERRTRWCK